MDGRRTRILDLYGCQSWHTFASSYYSPLLDVHASSHPPKSSSELLSRDPSSHVSWADQLIKRRWTSPHFTSSPVSSQSYAGSSSLWRLRRGSSTSSPSRSLSSPSKNKKMASRPLMPFSAAWPLGT